MTEDVRYIIDHMSPLELADLRERGRVVLPPGLAARADLAHARPLGRIGTTTGPAGTDAPAATDQGPGRGATAA